MTSTDSPIRPAYSPRHRDYRAVPDTGAWELLMRVGALTATAEAYAADLAAWRGAAFDLLIKVTPDKRGRRHAPESLESIAFVDGLLGLRADYLTAQISSASVGADWDLTAIKYLGQLA